MSGVRGWDSTAPWAAAALFAGAVLGPSVKAEAPAPVTDAAPPVASPRSVEDLRDFSIEQLSNLQVTSVAKSSQAIRDAPAAIYVITHDDVLRSGATSLADILRLAPNLQVSQISATRYVITARGFSGNTSDQSFSDKLLVLIDGRSVYTPLFSGVYWDMQSVPVEDIDRIEVISGPGAALWGANAVNGVINIITRKAAETQGGYIETGIGNLERGVSVHYGGKLSHDLAYRLYVQDVYYTDTVTAAGADAHDHGSAPQGGGRIDWTPTDSDVVTLSGDDYQGGHAQLGAPDESISGDNLLASWNHSWRGGGTFHVQAYWDRTARATPGQGSFLLDTYDIDAQAGFSLGGANQIVVGGGFRHSRYDITNTTSLLFLPAKADLDLGNAFVQDTLSITTRLALTAGLKIENDPYSGWTALPNVRLSWRPTDNAMVWGAVSRAIRSPTPFDTDVVEKVQSVVFLVGAPQFESEKVTAYELGARVEPSSRASASVSLYYNVYDDVRTVEPAVDGFIPLRWANGIRGDTWGLEAWSDYKLTPWWRMTASVTLLREQLAFKPGASGLLGVAQVGDDPRHQAQLRSSMDLGRHVSFETDLRYQDALPDPFVPPYVELNSRIAWDISRRVQISLSGFNLLHDHHQEFPAAEANAVPRSVYAALRLRF
jgi:iron complex outermembrane receptor protein